MHEMVVSKYPCICCGFIVMPDYPGSYALCPICGWEDDEAQARDPYYAGGANRNSLYAAQQMFLRAGVADGGLLPGSIRDPSEADERDTTWRPIDPAVDRFDPLIQRDKSRRELLYWKEPADAP